MRILKMLYCSLLLKKSMPFRIYSKSRIRIRRSADLKLGGRIVIGHRSDEASVSAAPVNFYLGHHSATKIGHSVCFGNGSSIIVKDKGRLTIGHSTYFTSDMHLEAENEIIIGSGCAISWGTTIIDSNHHKLIIEGKGAEIKGKVVIGDHVWIGCNVTILKDTHIGNNCMVAAGSVVKGHFPDNTLIAGNPAKVVKTSVDWE